MSDEHFELSRWNALLGFSTVGVATEGRGTGTRAYLCDKESFDDNTVTAGEMDLYADDAPGVDQRKASDETEATVFDDGEATTLLDRGAPVALSDDSRNDISCASPTTVVGPSGIFQPNDSLIGIPGFDSSAGHAPRRPEVVGRERLGGGLPPTAGNPLPSDQ